MRHLLLSAVLVLPVPAMADPASVLSNAVQGYIQPGFADLATSSAQMATTAEAHCAASDPELRTAFGAAWDDWIEMSHLRFGPTEVDNRAFALGFWPDSRGAIPKTLARLVADGDPAVNDPAEFAQISVAARGFTAMEFLLFDPAFAEDSPYLCDLRQAVAQDIAATTAAISDDWSGAYGAAFLSYGPDSSMRDETESLRALYGAIVTGLEFTKDARLGRPMGTFDRPRPTRAEAWRSGRTVRHIRLSLEGTAALADVLAGEETEVAAGMAAEYDRARLAIDRLQDPVLADVTEPSGWLRAEVVSQTVAGASLGVQNGIGVYYDLSAGFNALDGD